MVQDFVVGACPREMALCKVTTSTRIRVDAFLSSFPEQLGRKQVHGQPLTSRTYVALPSKFFPAVQISSACCASPSLSISKHNFAHLWQFLSVSWREKAGGLTERSGTSEDFRLRSAKQAALPLPTHANVATYLPVCLPIHRATKETTGKGRYINACTFFNQAT